MARGAQSGSNGGLSGQGAGVSANGGVSVQGAGLAARRPRLRQTAPRPARQRARAIAVLALASPASAFAHSPIEGLGHFYNGVLHPVLVPAHLVALLGLGLLLARQRPSTLRDGVVAALVGVVAGLAGAWVGWAPATALELPLLIGATLVGGGAAAEWRVPHMAAWALAGALGLAIGLDSIPAAADPVPASTALAMVSDPLATVLSLAGTALGAGLLLSATLLCGEVSSRVAWRRMALRVVGSWIAAAAFMVMALQVADRRAPTSAAEAALPTPVTLDRRAWDATPTAAGGLAPSEPVVSSAARPQIEVAHA